MKIDRKMAYRTKYNYIETRKIHAAIQDTFHKQPKPDYLPPNNLKQAKSRQKKHNYTVSDNPITQA